MRLSNKVVLATLNRGKYEEFLDLLKPYPEIELVTTDQLIRNPAGLSFAERHSTYWENAAAKARLINQASHYPTLADDSGLEVTALKGRPGVRSHRFATPKAGISQDEANNQLLLSELKGAQDRSAKFICCLALVIEGILIHATGTLEGSILEQPRGTHGFGYDPLFLPQGETRTLAQMTQAEKNAISHRAKALQQLMSQVRAHGIVFAKP
jgi:XTP/dITP diphosphohydrolase